MIWFLLVVGGLTFLGAKNAGIGGAIAGFFGGIVLWCTGALFWVVDLGYDCSEARENGTYYAEEKCH